MYRNWNKTQQNLIEWRKQQSPTALLVSDQQNNTVAHWIFSITKHQAIDPLLLEIGCGNGNLRLSPSFPAAMKYIGCDPLPVSSHYNFPFVLAMAEGLPFSAVFDYVLIKDSIDCMANIGLALSNIFMSLKPGGRLLLSEAGHQDISRFVRLNNLLFRLKVGQYAEILQRIFNVFRGSNSIPEKQESEQCGSLNHFDTYPNGDLTKEKIECAIRETGYVVRYSEARCGRLFIIAEKPCYRY